MGDMRGAMADVERIATAFHEAYERLAPEFGYKTRKKSALAWDDVPAPNKGLMRLTVAALISDGVIEVPAVIAMARETDVYLVRMGPPAKGDTIHLNTCRYAQKGNAHRWVFAEEHPDSWATVPWLNYCKVCDPIGTLKPSAAVSNE